MQHSALSNVKNFNNGLLSGPVYGGKQKCRCERCRFAPRTFWRNGVREEDFVICPSPLNLRMWEVVGDRTESTDVVFRFKLASYNVLAQYLLESNTRVGKNINTWEQRSTRLFNEIYELSADILCLQEVQKSHLKTFYSKFEDIGYSGVFKAKLACNEPDGCLIYYKRSLFKMEDSLSVEFHQPRIGLHSKAVGIMVKLTLHNSPGSSLVVATTHLPFKRNPGVRLAHMKQFLAEIDRFAYFDYGQNSGHWPIILTGDLNSFWTSDVVELLQKGRVNLKTHGIIWNWKLLGITDNCQYLSVYQNRFKRKITEFRELNIHHSTYALKCPVTSKTNELLSEQYNNMFHSKVWTHSLKLQSVYGKMDMVDYIFYSRRNKLLLLERLDQPKAMDYLAFGPLPNKVYGSDHFALAAYFKLNITKLTKSQN